jgi:hypothetical protein
MQEESVRRRIGGVQGYDQETPHGCAAGAVESQPEAQAAEETLNGCASGATLNRLKHRPKKSRPLAGISDSPGRLRLVLLQQNNSRKATPQKPVTDWLGLRHARGSEGIRRS